MVAALALPMAVLAPAPPLAAGPAGADGGPLTVAAASSLRTAVREIGETYRVRTGGALVFVFGSSGNLARQMEHGAPYDLFLSADETWVAALSRQGIVDAATVAAYATGRLVMVLFPPLRFPADRLPVGKEEMGLLGRAPVRNIALANPAHAPYGVAAREALRRAGLWNKLREKLTLAENVRQALTFVETGNAEAGLVAQSIATGSRLEWRPVAESLHGPIRQALGIRAKSPRSAEAARFVRLLFSPAGGRALARYGLRPLPGPSNGGTGR